jgi:hypothetical protein
MVAGWSETKKRSYATADIQLAPNALSQRKRICHELFRTKTLLTANSLAPKIFSSLAEQLR